MATINFNFRTREEDDTGFVVTYLNDLYDEVMPRVVQTAKARSPVKTGALRRSLDWEKQGLFNAAIHDGVFYGRYQEFGTSTIQPRRFAQSSVQDVFGSFETGIL